jgi:hypothetical protein
MKDYLDGTGNWLKCGNCDHAQVSHTTWLTKHPLEWISRCAVTHNGPIKLPEQCRCDEWVPKDNLDRIEFLAKKRHLV